MLSSGSGELTLLPFFLSSMLCQAMGSYLGSGTAKLVDEDVLQSVDDHHMVSTIAVVAAAAPVVGINNSLDGNVT